jgi:hypothetical protein
MERMSSRDSLSPQAHADATVIRGVGAAEGLVPHGYYTVWCVGPDGTEKWRDEIHNLVTTVGKNDFLDKYLGGSSYTQTFRMGLKGTGTAIAADTQASHASWLEVGLANAPTYTGSRKSVAMGSAAAGVATSPTQSFAMTSSGTVAGCFTNNGGSATIDNTTGILFSAGDFTGGNKIVANLDTINVTYSLSI